MTWLDRGLMQRIIGALVLVALMVIFIPMLLTREDEMRQVSVETPPMPAMPEIPRAETQPVAVPEPVAVRQSSPAPQIIETTRSGQAPEPITQVAEPTPEPQPAPSAGLDASGLPMSWTVQLASMSVPANADRLVKELREQGYNAYQRRSGNMHRVFVGPVVERTEADRLRDLLARQKGLKGLVVRFEPERR